jgi:hypothetical protein
VVWQAALQKAIVLTFQNELTFKNWHEQNLIKIF